jgi:mono/diheme cytochrome c family protein
MAYPVRNMPRIAYILLGLTGILPAQEAPTTGEAIYAQHCASCHGKDGEGVPDEVEDPLHGERPLGSLARYIDRRMPEDDPDILDADQSQLVAEYIYGKFYSAQARAKTMPAPKAAFARLTNQQFRESVADLIGSFSTTSQPGEGTGLQAQYFQSDGMNKKARKALERHDTELDFDFGEGSPAEGISTDQFSIAWDGSLIAPETGWYEFKIITPNGARLYLNGDRQDGDGNHRDDSAAKRQPAVIDAWVSSGDEIREASARVFLLGGRAYPLRFDYFKYMDKRGMVRLEWKPPHGRWAPLAVPYLSPAPASHVAVVTTTFPADDASEGYERGTGISKDWHEATTTAAIEVANQVVSRLSRLSGANEDAPDRAERLKQFIHEFAARAFRRPLTDDLRQLYVDQPFSGEQPLEQAVKRAVIQVLKSPRFLYPEWGQQKDEMTVASRLALGLWDSLPDQQLTAAAAAGELRTPEQVAAQAKRMANDPRAKAKLLGFFDRWLKLSEESDLNKDPTSFPGFDETLVADLRRSLELFVERVVWSDQSNYRELIEADYLLFNQRLADFYQVPMPEGGGFQPVKFDPALRAGVLTHPYLLARLSHPDLTSPIHRGVFITRNILGGILKPPPEAIAFENHKFDPNMTMREKVVEMTRNTSCMTCHETINPLGFSLENFDPVGRFRLREGEKPIDPVSDYLTQDGEIVRLAGPRDVATYAVSSTAARQGFIRQLFQYSVKQNPAVYGHETIGKLDTAFVASGENIRHLLADIVAFTAVQGVPVPDQAAR